MCVMCIYTINISIENALSFSHSPKFKVLYDQWEHTKYSIVLLYTNWSWFYIFW